MVSPSIEIQRLVLRIPGTSREEGHRVAELVVERLGQVTVGQLKQRTLGNLRVRVQAEPGITPDRLASRVAEAVEEALR